jgi:prepilin-type N-terminal cleavage/methylation domain-containing protein
MRRARGFTLSELMISIALFGLIAAAALSLTLSASRSQARSARVDVAQSSLRAALEFLTRDVLMASAGASSGRITPYGASTATTAINLTGGNSSTGPDTLELYLVDGSVAAQIPAGVAAGVTSLGVTYEASSGQFAANTTAHPSYVQIGDLTTAIVAQLTGVSGNATTATLTVSALPAGFTSNVYVLPSRHVVYSVATPFGVENQATASASMLMLQVDGGATQPVAEGIEDMQIAYGFDNNGDGAIPEVGAIAGDDEWLYNTAGESLGTWSIDRLRVVRITVVAKSTSAEPGSAQFGTVRSLEDRPTIGADAFIRRVMRTEIAVRNFNL